MFHPLLRTLALAISLMLLAATMPWRALGDVPAPVSLASATWVEEDVKDTQTPRDLLDAMNGMGDHAVPQHAYCGDQQPPAQPALGVPDRPPKV